MSNTLKSIASISGKVAGGWLMIFATGLVFSIVYIVVAGLKLLNSQDTNFYHLLSLVILVIFPVIYYFIANKIAIRTALNQVWENKISGWLSPKISSYLDKIERNQPAWLHNASDSALIKLKLLETNKSDSDSSKWQKRIIAYGLKKANLDDVDFNNENTRVSTILSDKIFNAIAHITRPSSKLLWLFVLIHTLIFILLLV